MSNGLSATFVYETDDWIRNVDKEVILSLLIIVEILSRSLNVIAHKSFKKGNDCAFVAVAALECQAL